MSWLPPEWSKCIVMIEQLSQEEANQPRRRLEPIATGFIVRYQRLNVFITCRHCLVKQEDTYITTNSKKEQKVIAKPLSDILETPNVSLCFHPNAKIDLVAMPFPVMPESDDILAVPSDLFEDSENFSEGDDIFFLGFPLGITTQGKIKPLVRSGIVSLKEEKNAFLIDANVFPGSSGSPVFLKPSVIDWKTMTIGKVRPPRLIGILSGCVTYSDEAVSRQTGRTRVTFEENAALAQAYSTTIIKEILDSTEFLQMRERLSPRSKP